jgi:hypothetical protein
VLRDARGADLAETLALLAERVPLALRDAEQRWHADREAWVDSKRQRVAGILARQWDPDIAGDRPEQMLAAMTPAGSAELGAVCGEPYPGLAAEDRERREMRVLAEEQRLRDRMVEVLSRSWREQTGGMLLTRIVPALPSADRDDLAQVLADAAALEQSR